jgi:hypothetical protein
VALALETRIEVPTTNGDPLGRGEGLLLGRAHGGHVRVAGVPGREPERVLLGEQAGAVVAVAVAEDDRLGQEPPGPERLVVVGDELAGERGADGAAGHGEPCEGDQQPVGPPQGH